MKSISFTASLLILAIAFVASASAFVPKSAVSMPSTRMVVSELKMVVGGEKERESLTRDSEPEDYFKTNTDKMTDAEKLPIALAGIAFITLPFLAGLVALFAAK